MMEQINKQAPKVNFDEAPLLDKEKIKKYSSTQRTISIY